MIKLLSLLAIVATLTTSHITGHLATKGTNGAWARHRIDLQEGTTVVNVSAAANGKNTYLNCVFSDPLGTNTVIEHHVLLCDANVKRLALPSFMVLDIANDNNGPVDYDITVQNTK